VPEYGLRDFTVVDVETKLLELSKCTRSYLILGQINVFAAVLQIQATECFSGTSRCISRWLSLCSDPFLELLLQGNQLGNHGLITLDTMNLQFLSANQNGDIPRLLPSDS